MAAIESWRAVDELENDEEFKEFCQALGASDNYMDDLLTDQWHPDLVCFDHQLSS